MTQKNEIINSLSLEKDVKSESSKEVPCLKCNRSFEFPEGKDNYLAHLYLGHRLVISDVQDIPFLEEYLRYWVVVFKGEKVLL